MSDTHTKTDDGIKRDPAQNSRSIENATQKGLNCHEISQKLSQALDEQGQYFEAERLQKTLNKPWRPQAQPKATASRLQFDYSGSMKENHHANTFTTGVSNVHQTDELHKFKQRIICADNETQLLLQERGRLVDTAKKRSFNKGC